eukprot:CAMPEP_0185839034 /NCGR_PEP_ID=MMETSP1353-20130828/13945_1 /TAXON_ID=1077150 /ORGANISM="Erythrolobus australicus, Strain CCMP3124" /LENGTH=128 /DNA_ID=CAMNT_0028538147 /DNA_START=292 /DNA_END=675 /DNA_ORIENTATION=+
MGAITHANVCGFRTARAASAAAGAALRRATVLTTMASPWRCVPAPSQFRALSWIWLTEELACLPRSLTLLFSPFGTTPSPRATPAPNPIFDPASSTIRSLSILFVSISGTLCPQRRTSTLSPRSYTSL